MQEKPALLDVLAEIGPPANSIPFVPTDVIRLPPSLHWGVVDDLNRTDIPSTYFGVKLAIRLWHENMPKLEVRKPGNISPKFIINSPRVKPDPQQNVKPTPSAPSIPTAHVPHTPYFPVLRPTYMVNWTEVLQLEPYKSFGLPNALSSRFYFQATSLN